MSKSIHVLIVRAEGLLWALPMDSVEQTLAFADRRVHDVAGTPILVFRGDALDVVDIAARLGFGAEGERVAGVVVWAGGRRRIFAVDELIGQMILERDTVPRAAEAAHMSSLVLMDD